MTSIATRLLENPRPSIIYIVTENDINTHKVRVQFWGRRTELAIRRRLIKERRENSFSYSGNLLTCRAVVSTGQDEWGNSNRGIDLETGETVAFAS